MKNSVAFLALFLLIVNIIVWQSYPNFAAWQTGLVIILLIAICIAFFYWVKKNPLAGSAFVTLLLLAGVLLRIAYLSDTPFSVRSQDAQGHLDYVNYIAQHRSLPKAGDCWQCYHPPLYYLAVSPICMAFSCQGTAVLLLQLASLIFDFGFLYFGIKLLRLLLPTKTDDLYFRLAAALLIFWPSGIINSVRIGNDSLLYFLMACGLYFITLWFINEKAYNLWLSAVFLVLSLFTKANGLILFGVVGFVMLIKFLKSPNKKKIFLTGLKIFLLISFFFSLLFLQPTPNQNSVKTGNLLVANAGSLSGLLRVGNKLANYITFDAKDYFRNVFNDPWSDSGGRQYFSNALLKTSLFGEFSFWQDFLKKAASLENYFFLFLLCLIGIGMIFSIVDLFNFLRKKISEFPINLLIAPIALTFIIAILIFRYLYPFSCSNNFRYIYPITIYISAAAAYCVHRIRQVSLYKTRTVANSLKLAAMTGEATIYLFITTSVIFFIGLAIL